MIYFLLNKNHSFGGSGLRLRMQVSTVVVGVPGVMRPRPPGTYRITLLFFTDFLSEYKGYIFLYPNSNTFFQIPFGS